DWAGRRQAEQDNEWSSRQWPAEVRREADRLADLLRSHAGVPPVVHFVEWADLWSMGDLIAQCLSAGNGAGAVRVYGERYEMSAHLLPDKGVLARHLANAGPRQHPET